VRGSRRKLARTGVLALSLLGVSAEAAPVRGPQVAKPLRWKAPRGNAGKPPPNDPYAWPRFNGAWPADHRVRYLDPAHHDPVPLPGLRPALPHPTTAPTPTAIGASLLARGVAAPIAARAARNVLLGLPSDANRTAEDDYLIARNDLVLSYSSSRKSPNWASWVTTREHAGQVGRSDHTWRSDPSLPAHFGFSTFHDYEGAGYDPGHLLPAGERRNSARASARTYVTTNHLPQAFNSNRGPWLRFENSYLHHVQEQDLEAHVLAGGVYGQRPLTIGSGIPVPNAMWKIVVLLGRGQTLADVTPATRVLAILIPNSDAEVNPRAGFDRYLTSPAEIERQTGLRFFNHLPQPLADALRGKIDPGLALWPPRE